MKRKKWEKGEGRKWEEMRKKGDVWVEKWMRKNEEKREGKILKRRKIKGKCEGRKRGRWEGRRIKNEKNGKKSKGEK